MKLRTFVLVGVLSFIGFVIAGAPVATIWPRLAPTQPSLMLSGLSGTVLNGSASAVAINGQPVARPLHWRFRPLALLAARLGFHVDGELDGLTFAGNVARTLGGALAVSDLDGSGSLKSLLTITRDSFMPVDGNVSIRIDTLRVVNRLPKQVTGTLSLRDVRWSLTREPQLLGDFEIAVTTEADVIVARVSPTAGPLDVGGEIRLLPDRSYETDLKVKTKPGAAPAIQNLVRTLGQADPEGYFRIKTRAQF